MENLELDLLSKEEMENINGGWWKFLAGVGLLILDDWDGVKRGFRDATM